MAENNHSNHKVRLDRGFVCWFPKGKSCNVVGEFGGESMRVMFRKIEVNGPHFSRELLIHRPHKHLPKQLCDSAHRTEMRNYSL